MAVERMSDYEGGQYLSEEGAFEFEITNAERTISSSGNPLMVFDVQSDHGTSRIYQSLDTKSRYFYNKLIKAVLHLDAEKVKTFELDYDTIGQQLVGGKFIGIVKESSYNRTVKQEQDDGTFIDVVETRVNYKITDYKDTNGFKPPF